MSQSQVRRRRARGDIEKGGASDQGCRRCQGWRGGRDRDRAEERRERAIGRRARSVRGAQAGPRPAGLRPVRELVKAAVQAEGEAFDVVECCRQEENFVNKKPVIAAALNCLCRSESRVFNLKKETQ